MASVDDILGKQSDSVDSILGPEKKATDNILGPEKKTEKTEKTGRTGYYQDPRLTAGLLAASPVALGAGMLAPGPQTDAVKTNIKTAAQALYNMGLAGLDPRAGLAKKTAKGQISPSVVEERAADVAKGYLPGLLGSPAEFYNFLFAGSEARAREGLRNILSAYGKEDAVSPESVMKPSPYTMDYFSKKMLEKPKTKGASQRREIGGLLGGMTSPMAFVKALKTTEAPFTVGGGPMSGVRAKAGEIAAAGEEAATLKAVSEVDRRLDQVPDLKRHIETITPKVEARIADSRKEAGLANPDTRSAFEAGTDINSDATKIITSKFKSAEDLKKSVGGQAFENYKIAANLKQEAQPFAQSPQGKDLLGQLDEIIKGGTGRLRVYSPEESRLAADIKANLFPTGKEAKPVDFKLVDDKLRELRDKASRKGIEAFSAVERERVVGIADRIENALKTWVGPENYPREVYAKSAEELNALQDKINLVARQRGEYEKGIGDIVVEQNPTDIMFKDRRSTQLSKDLYGADDVNALAERYAVNKITSLGDPEKITKWLNSKESAFIDEVPGLSGKLTKYVEGLARREGDVKALEALQKRLAGIPEEVKGLGEQAQKATDVIQETLRRIDFEQPTKIYDVFVKDLRPKLEQTGVIPASSLNELEKALSQASKAASREEAINIAKTAFMKVGLPALGIGAPAYGIIQGVLGEK